MAEKLLGQARGPPLPCIIEKTERIPFADVKIVVQVSDVTVGMWCVEVLALRGDIQ